MHAPRRATCPPLPRVHLYPSKQFISSHFKSTLFSMNLTYFPKSHFWALPTLVALNFVKIQLSRNSTKFVRVTKFRETKTVKSVSSSAIYKIFRFSICTIATNFRYALFQKNSIFLTFYIISPLKEFCPKISHTAHTIACICNSHLISMTKTYLLL